VKRRFEISEEQQLVLGLLLALLIAISLLYCLAFASMALHQAWQAMPLPWSEEGEPALTPTLGPEASPTPGALFAPAVPPGVLFDRTLLQGYNRLVVLISKHGERGRRSWRLSPY
jgi:hypothetical protein